MRERKRGKHTHTHTHTRSISVNFQKITAQPNDFYSHFYGLLFLIAYEWTLMSLPRYQLSIETFDVIRKWIRKHNSNQIDRLHRKSSSWEILYQLAVLKSKLNELTCFNWLKYNSKCFPNFSIFQFLFMLHSICIYSTWNNLMARKLTDFNLFRRFFVLFIATIAAPPTLHFQIFLNNFIFFVVSNYNQDSYPISGQDGINVMHEICRHLRFDGIRFFSMIEYLVMHSIFLTYFLFRITAHTNTVHFHKKSVCVCFFSQLCNAKMIEYHPITTCLWIGNKPSFEEKK